MLEETLALAHPLIPFVTEEIHSFLPGAEATSRCARYPEVDAELVDEQAEREVGTVIEAVRRLRNYRDSVGAPAAAGRTAAWSPTTPYARRLREGRSTTIERLARYELAVDGGDGEVVSSIGARGCDGRGPAQRRRRLAEAARAQLERDPEAARRRDRARARQARQQGLHGQGARRAGSGREDKLERYEAELAELESQLDRDDSLHARAAGRAVRCCRWRCSACASGSSACGA